MAAGLTSVSVRAKNACGWSNWFELPFEITELPPTSQRQDQSVYTIFPNPSDTIVNIELRNKNNAPTQEAVITGELFDLSGQTKSTIEIVNNKATFSVAGLNRGVYVLKIYINNKVESHQIAVE